MFKNISFPAILILLVVLFSANAKLAAQDTLNRMITDNSGTEMLLGHCTKERLLQAPFNSWFNKNEADYIVDTLTLDSLKPLLTGKKFEIFMGTWCSDSKREVPRIFKILDYCKVKAEDIILIMLDNRDSAYKQSPGHEERPLDIHHVPDLLVYDQANEMGRIVESPVKSLERDLLSIVANRNYQSNYPALAFLSKLFKEEKIADIRAKESEWMPSMKLLSKQVGELITYGHVLMTAGRMPEANIAFTCNTILYPANTDAFLSLANYYKKMGDIQSAKVNYQKVLKIEPGNEPAEKMLQELGNN